LKLFINNTFLVSKSGLVAFFILYLSYSISAQEPKEINAQVLIRKIEIEGNKKTKSDIILRETGFEEGDSIKLSKLPEVLLRAKNNILNTYLFNEVKVENITDGRVIDIKIVVVERWYLVAYPEVLMADRSFNEWWYDRGRDLKRLSIGANAKHFNLSGNQDQLRIRALGGFVNYYEVGYSRPYIDKRKRIGIRSSLFYTTQRSLPYRTWNDKLDFLVSEETTRKRTGGYFEFRLRNALYHFHFINIGLTQYEVSDTLSLLNPFYLGERKTMLNLFNFVYQYRYDKRDNRQYALRGSQLKLELGSYMSFSKSMLYLGADYYKFIPLAKKFYLGSLIKSKVSIPRSQLYPTIKGIGYDSYYLRGYDLYVIDAQHYLIQRNTLRYQVFQKVFDIKKILKLKQFNSIPLDLYPNLFFDYGLSKNYFPERSNTKLGNRFLYGYGLGLDFVTYYNTTFKVFGTLNHRNEKGVFFGIYRE
jgi:hypothetical protein